MTFIFRGWWWWMTKKQDNFIYLKPFLMFSCARMEVCSSRQDPCLFILKKKHLNSSCTPVTDSCSCICWYICVTPGTFCRQQLAELVQLLGGCHRANGSPFPEDRRRKSEESVQRLLFFVSMAVWSHHRRPVCLAALRVGVSVLITDNILQWELLPSLVWF